MLGPGYCSSSTARAMITLKMDHAHDFKRLVSRPHAENVGENMHSDTGLKGQLGSGTDHISAKAESVRVPSVIQGQ